MKRGWELLALLVIAALLVKALFDFILPLVPYVAIAGVVLLVGGFFYNKHRSW